MLHPVQPLSIKLATIWPVQHTMPLLLVLDETSNVLSAVAVDEFALSVHLVVVEATLIVAAIWPQVLALAFHHVLSKVSLVARPIEHDKLSVTMSETILILSLESSILPDLGTHTVLFIISPNAIIGGLICAIKLARSTPLIIFKVTDVVTAIRVDHSSESVKLPAYPVTFVASAIGPNLTSTTMALRATPLAKVLDENVDILDSRLVTLHHLLVDFS